jgi:hypothetical protein
MTLINNPAGWMIRITANIRQEVTQTC